MRELLNVLYVQTQGTALHLDHDAIKVEMEGEPPRRLPLLRLGGIVLFGRVLITAPLMERCADDGRSVVWLNERGRFKARLEGPTHGNVLLRRAQHLALSDEQRTWRIARQMVAAKIQNSRQLLLRAARESSDEGDRRELGEAAAKLAAALERLRESRNVDQTRGEEGEAARDYFAAFGKMVRAERDVFAPRGRSRRPPRDPTNAVLSFLYTLLRMECVSALESVGLDPQVGYLHALRPGRPSLALDLMEELRPVIADRLALTLVNRRQLRPEHFEGTPGGGVLLSADGRRIVLVAYQQRKDEALAHRVLDRKVPLGLVPHLQARLLARYLRDDIADYPPFLYR